MKAPYAYFQPRPRVWLQANSGSDGSCLPDPKCFLPSILWNLAFQISFLPSSQYKNKASSYPLIKSHNAVSLLPWASPECFKDASGGLVQGSIVNQP